MTYPFHWFSEQVGLSGDLGSTNDVLIPLCMTRSSIKELFPPLEDPKRELRSSRKLFKTPSLDESSSPKFDLFSDLKEHFEEKITEAMGETMEEYMCKTRGNYGSGVARPKIDDKAHFDLKGQFLKKLCDNTFSGSDQEDANEHIEIFFEIVDLFHIPKITQDQVMLRAFFMSLVGAAICWLRNEPAGSITTWETLKEFFLTWERFMELLLRCPQHYLIDMQEVIVFNKGLEVPTRDIPDSKGDIPSMKDVEAKKAIQEMVDHSQKWHNGTSTRCRSTETSGGLADIQAQLNNLGREIKKVNEKVYAAQVGCELSKGPHYTKDCPLKEEGKTLEEAYYTQFGVPFLQRIQYKAAAQDSTKGTIETLHIKSEDKQWKNR
ncbi:hypothetical protein Tco_1231442 [Tanacetum coccineum]